MRSLVVLLVLASLFGTNRAQAQLASPATDVTASGVSYSTFARPGDVTVQVLVISNGRSGIYEVTKGTGIERLLALSGTGWEVGGEVERKINVRLMRTVNGRRVVVYEAPLERMLLDAEKKEELMDGDILSVESRIKRKFEWRDALAVLTSVSTLVLVFERLTYRY